MTPGAHHAHTAARSAWFDATIVGALPVIAFLLLIFWIGPRTTWLRIASPPGRTLMTKHELQLPVHAAVKLIGYNLAPQTVSPGREVHVRLYWQGAAPLDRDYASFVQFVAGDRRQEIARSDHQHPGDIPTTTWSAARYVVDDHYVALPEDAPSVALRVMVGLYRTDTLEWLGAVELPELLHVARPFDLRTARLTTTSASSFDDNIALLGHRLEESADGLTLTLFWRASAQPAADYQVFIHALDPAGNLIAQADGPPVAGLYPSSTWLPGQVIVDAHHVALAGAEATSLRMGLYRLDNMARLSVRPERDATTPRDAVEISVAAPARGRP